MSATQLVATVAAPLLPTLIVMLGGYRILQRHDLAQRRREEEVQLVRWTRQRQYELVVEVGALFQEFMRLYRMINEPSTDLADPETLGELRRECITAEARVDGLIVRIAAEFVGEGRGSAQLEQRLGEMRQSIQIWRERLRTGERLPFQGSDQPDYVRFKRSFAEVAAYLSAETLRRFDDEVPERDLSTVSTLIVGAFDNKYEKHGYHG